MGQLQLNMVLILHWFYNLRRKKVKRSADQKISFKFNYYQKQITHKLILPVNYKPNIQVHFLLYLFSMQNPNRITKCYTEGSYNNEIIAKIKGFLNQPKTQALTKQSKFINPYSKQKIHKKTYRFQEPHSIILVSKKHKKVQSEIKSTPFVAEQQQIKQKYKTDKIIRKGLLSSVFIGFHQSSGKKVAIKKINQYSNIKNKQSNLLIKLEHDNIVNLIDHYYTFEQSRKIQCLVMQYYSTDLYKLTHQNKKGLSQHLIANYAYQILKGLEHMHKNYIVHRDFKSSNILINILTEKAVVGDLGSARQISFGETVSGQPCPFSYRAPQIAFGVNNYSFGSDMWAFACVLFQMSYLDIPFKARNSTELTIQIINMLGTPYIQQIYQFDDNYDARQYENLPKIKGKYPNCMNSKTLLNDLLKRLFVFSPDRRLTSSQALSHQYFTQIKFNEELTKNTTLQSQISSNNYNSQKKTLITPSKKQDGSNMKTVATLQDQQATDYPYKSNKTKSNLEGRMVRMTPTIFKKLHF